MRVFYLAKAKIETIFAFWMLSNICINSRTVIAVDFLTDILFKFRNFVIKLINIFFRTLENKSSFNCLSFGKYITPSVSVISESSIGEKKAIKNDRELLIFWSLMENIWRQILLAIVQHHPWFQFSYACDWSQRPEQMMSLWKNVYSKFFGFVAFVDISVDLKCAKIQRAANRHTEKCRIWDSVGGLCKLTHSVIL